MGRKDASATGLPVDQYRKQIGEFSFLLEAMYRPDFFFFYLLNGQKRKII